MNHDKYIVQFPYRGKEIYTKLYERHADIIKTKKQAFAVNNLEMLMS